MCFDVIGGEITAVVGQNGSGKTTLLRAFSGLQTYTGQIRVNGEPSQLGIVFQNPDLQLFNSSVREEILYRIPSPDMTYYRWLVQAMGLVDYEKTPPLLLSEGEKKRVALATVLMRQPQHGILLDEPSLGQDMAHKQMLLGILHALSASGQIVLFTTHDLWLAAQADRLLLLGNGGVIADGKPSELMQRADLWQEAGLVVPSWLKVCH
jgi:energy-coupling factor transporter ATP-binding protein EcfA2